MQLRLQTVGGGLTPKLRPVCQEDDDDEEEGEEEEDDEKEEVLRRYTTRYTSNVKPGPPVRLTNIVK